MKIVKEIQIRELCEWLIYEFHCLCFLCFGFKVDG
jgi:hypothetical protein